MWFMIFEVDVLDEGKVNVFVDVVRKEFDMDYIYFFFNNVGIGGGGFIVDGDWEEWEKMFNVCWGGVYYCFWVFFFLLVVVDEGYIINISSVNGFWVLIGYLCLYMVYFVVKFVVKGFIEVFVNDLWVNVLYVKCFVVMLGYIGIKIVDNFCVLLIGFEDVMLLLEDLCCV